MPDPDNKPLDASPDTIQRLQHTVHAQALDIQRVFQSAYRGEARLIGVTNFPPLERTVRDIKASGTAFYGCRREDKLLAVIEVDYDDPLLDIHSLAVHPDYSRQALGTRLLRHVLDAYHWETAEVETAIANAPAVTLYEGFGFAETARFATPAGIIKVRLRL